MDLFLLLLFCSVSSAVKHSLINYFTGSSGVPHLSEFVGVAAVDGVGAVYCDSSNKILEQRQDWAQKVFDNDPQLLHWYQHECFKTQPDAFRARIVSLKQQFNQSGGFHILQARSGCEWDRSTKEVSGFLKYGYDGEDFIELDLRAQKWIAAKPEANITKQSWDADGNRTQLNVLFLTHTCRERLQVFLKSGNSSLQRTVLPSVSLLQKSPSSPISCHATSFYPHRAVMFWRKDGEEIHEGVDLGEILPNNDGTFQISADLNVSSVTPADWSRYECVFQLSGVEDAIITTLNKRVIRTNRRERRSNPAVPVIVVLVLVLVAAAGFAVYKKKKASGSSCDVSDRQNRDGT
ncbi:major histocompatibility complex class I-related gene protein-like isoform X2 [Archocentrus centrarchus]|uniref:major histocompatibility complex class I-related gene protein-like isoform X2 n=1 Tax=Archocentrus centrarchus TaxID=63155 RepID=UPI0011E9B78C|nr:major histocompatibility complex class I-related gene protein-like isoform X2 [Archocentrus centrarchus]